MYRILRRLSSSHVKTTIFYNEILKNAKLKKFNFSKLNYSMQTYSVLKKEIRKHQDQNFRNFEALEFGIIKNQIWHIKIAKHYFFFISDCARNVWLLSQHGATELPKCCIFGNFESWQHRRSQYYCVDENGDQIGLEMDSKEELCCYKEKNGQPCQITELNTKEELSCYKENAGPCQITNINQREEV